MSVIPPRPVMRVMWALHKGLFAVSGGRIGVQAPSGDKLGMLFLLSTGRTTGAVRRNGLYYVEDGPNLGVVASNLGADSDPAWWKNLQVTPEATVDLDGEQRLIRARPANPDERERIWATFVRGSSQYAEYERLTSRAIPVVVFEPR